MSGQAQIIYPYPRPFPASGLKLETTAWYALHTRSNFEKKVAVELTAQGIQNYVPLLRELHRWKDSNKLVESPVFPGYVFARFANTMEARLRVLRAAGTVRILGHGDNIEPIPETEIESVRRLLIANPVCFVQPFLRIGSWVRVKRGPLRDVEGRLMRVKNLTRLVVSVTLLSRSVATEIDIHDVEVICAAPDSVE